MSGHSKWANNKHRKALQDAKRGKIFTKMIRELITAVRLGGNDLASNSRLRAAVDKALFNNMTRDTINRAILRGVCNNENLDMETFIYEGYASGGTAVIVECLSNNRNRTVAEVRYAFSKNGGHLGTNGSVSHLFSKKGIIFFKEGNEDAIIDVALELDVENVLTHNDGTIEIYTAWEKLAYVYDVLKKSGLKADKSAVSMVPYVKTNLSSEAASNLLRLTYMLEDYEDVQEVYHNGEISDDVSMIL